MPRPAPTGFEDPLSVLIGRQLEGVGLPVFPETRQGTLAETLSALANVLGRTQIGTLRTSKGPITPEQTNDLMRELRFRMIRLLKGDMPPKAADPQVIRQLQAPPGQMTLESPGALELGIGVGRGVPVLPEIMDHLIGHVKAIPGPKGLIPFIRSSEMREAYPIMSMKSDVFSPRESLASFYDVIDSLLRRGLLP